MQKAKELRESLIADFTHNHMEKLFYYCLKKTGKNGSAEDLTQDIALQVIASLEKGTVPTNFSAWVWQIARNRYAAWAKEKHSRKETVSGFDAGDYDGEDENADILGELIHTEQMALLRRELAFIKSEYRNIVVAYYLEYKSVRDIALSLSLSESAVQQRLHRARIILKEGMDMAREFGKLSYNPENISFINNGLRGANGEPWNFISRSLCKNILLAAYRTPSAAEELAMEIGVALPYMEEELTALVDATLMKKNGSKYETNFFIVSAEAQKKINASLNAVIPELTKVIIEATEFEINWKNENCPRWHGGYQPLEDMKWALLMQQTDTVNFQTLNTFNLKRQNVPKANLGKWGHTVRPNDGEWDILGFENYEGDEPSFVGLVGCVTSPAERDLKEINFQQYKFQYRGISEKTPETIPYSYAEALVSAAKGETGNLDAAVVAYLEKYGYIERQGDRLKPTFLVMDVSKNKEMPPEALETLKGLRETAVNIAMGHYLFCREQIHREIPAFLKDDEYQIDHACANIFTLRGAVLEEALRLGYISWEEGDEGKMLGTFLKI